MDFGLKIFCLLRGMSEMYVLMVCMKLEDGKIKYCRVCFFV